MQTISNICKIDDFKAIVKSNNNIFDIRWGKTILNNSVFCSFEEFRFFNKPNVFLLDKLFDNSNNIPSMEELMQIGTDLGMSEEQLIPWMKNHLKRSIAKHDKSRGANGVENFSINGINLWLDKDTRTGLLLRFQAEKASGKTDTVLWNEGMAFPLTIDNGIQMLYAIEVYASATYDLKEQLLAAADKLKSVAELIAFDGSRKNGYPAQLAF